jgi:hypothetical protein
VVGAQPPWNTRISRVPPSECPFHSPAAWDDGEALLAFGFAHDVQRGAQHAAGPLDQFAGEASVSEHEPHRRGQVMLNRVVSAPSRSCILGGQDDHDEDKPSVSVTMKRLRPLMRLPAS